MFSRYLLPLLALIGFLSGVFTTVRGNQPPPVAQPAAEPAQPPFHSFIAGGGIIEAKSRNIAIGTPLPGIVKRLAVKVGDRVEPGAVLFALDDREAQAELLVRRADLARAKAGLAEAQAGFNQAKVLLNLAEAVADRRAISVEELERRRNALLIAKAQQDSAAAQISVAEAQLGAAQTTLERLTVRAPVAGEVLQVNLRPGEFAQAGSLGTPLLVMGNLDLLHVRVDIDENDAWRFKPDGQAVAFMRGNRMFSAPLKLAYVEPYVVPKRSLTGDSAERVDTRVLQALYSFDRAQLPAYVGQQLDVFIEAPEYNEGSGSAAAAPAAPRQD